MNDDKHHDLKVKASLESVFGAPAESGDDPIRKQVSLRRASADPWERDLIAYRAMAAVVEAVPALNESPGLARREIEGFDRESYRRDTTEAIADDERLVHVAVDAFGRVCGHVMVSLRGRVGSLYVQPERRREGIATRLLQAAAQWGADRGIERLEFRVPEGNVPFVALAGKLGFEAAPEDPDPAHWAGPLYGRRLTGNISRSARDAQSGGYVRWRVFRDSAD